MAKAITESSNSELFAIASREQNKAKNFALQFSIPHFYNNYESLLADKEIDAVYIGLPNHLHQEWIVRCALAGKHVLCEKPLVISHAEALKIKEVIEETQVCCMEGLMYLHHPLIQSLQEIIAQQIIGEVRLYNAVYTANIASLANPREGGSIRNLGCYPVSLIRLLAQNEPSAMQGIGRLNAQRTSDHSATLILKFPDEAMATISTADDLEMRWQFEVYGSKGHLKLLSNPWLPEKTDNKMMIQVNGEKLPQEIKIQAPRSLYTYQIDAFNHQILNPNQSELPLSFSFGNLNVLETWREQVFKSL
ncbi:Gfo/Idh/MocA family oxidoreductase [Legionella sp. km772]|nr:Gfo/Idh/MocA family oxidoreductase [Legionella sp. km772]